MLKDARRPKSVRRESWCPLGRASALDRRLKGARNVVRSDECRATSSAIDGREGPHGSVEHSRVRDDPGAASRAGSGAANVLDVGAGAGGVGHGTGGHAAPPAFVVAGVVLGGRWRSPAAAP